MKKINFITLLLLAFTLSSCSREEDYEFLVTNDTEYNINKVGVDWCNKDNYITIRAGETYGPFTLIYKKSFYNSFGPGSLCMTVITYSDSLLTYENTIGMAIERSYLKKDAINRISIKVKTNIDPENPNDIFVFNLNK